MKLLVLIGLLCITQTLAFRHGNRHKRIRHGPFGKRPRAEARKRAELKRGAFRSAILVDQDEVSGTKPKEIDFSLSLETDCSNSQRSIRTADGSCNNVRHPHWGQAGAPYVRMATPAYNDGESIPRIYGESTGEPLPSPRTISTHVMDTISHPSRKLTLMVMQWGQFIDHDLGSTPAMSVDSKQCCKDLTRDPKFTEDGCFPIHILKGDPYFNDTNCMPFGRSQEFPSTRHREQFNAITTFIDGSMIYGSSDDETKSLRTGENGLMLITDGNLLPKDDTVGACRDDFCFLAGDSRVNVFPGLTALHTIFVRFHNQIAKELNSRSTLKALFSARGRRLSDEELFQTTRKIVYAIIQKITYKDYLPVILGDVAIRRHRFNEPYKYKPRVNPTIINAFATAAFRYGHSLIPDTLRIDGENVPIHKLFFQTKSVIHHFRDVVENLVRHHSENSDRSVTGEMMNKLFKTVHGSLDVVALNIQRGRDHGLPSFNEYRSRCRLRKLKSFDEPEFGKCGPLLQSVYKSPNDVDLFVGGLCERPTEGGELGKTFSCIIGGQFSHLRDGDRFFYEGRDPDVAFTHEQLNYIEEMSLSKILCNHGDIKSVQSNVFFPIDGSESGLNSNGLRLCSDFSNRIPSLRGFMK